MTASSQQGREAERVVRQATDSKLIKTLGRVGLVAYGVVHLLMGYLAALVATGRGGAQTDKTGALMTLAAQPGGRWALWLVTVGLAALVVWQLVEAVWGHRRFAAARRTKKRLVNAGEAVIFGALAYAAFKTVTGSAKSSGEPWTAQLLAVPFGRLLVAAIGLGVIAIAAFVVRHGVTKGFTEDLDVSTASPAVRRLTIRLGQVGYPALGVAYGVVGALIVVAAVHVDPNKATGLDAALKTLAAQPYGTILLGLVAAGLVCFGVYCMFDARFRRS